MTGVLLVGVGALVGAPVRYLAHRAIQTRHAGRFPFGTLAVNAVACAVLGVVTGVAGPAEFTTLVGTGFCATLSTYSTFADETVRLLRLRARAVAVLYVVVSVLAGLGLVELGRLLGERW